MSLLISVGILAGLALCGYVCYQAGEARLRKVNLPRTALRKFRGKSRAVAMVALLAAAAIHRATAQTTETLKSLATPMAASSPTIVPMLVRYDGSADRSDGKPKTGASPVTFLVYKEERGGEPLWMETQSVGFDANGKYEVYLGSTLSSGLPTDLFGTGEARWLEVQITGEPVQPRTLLVSVPYALHAADAATLGGLPASAFARAGSLGSSATAAPDAVAASSSNTVTTPGGTAGLLPVWTGTSTIGNSIIYQTATGIGIGKFPNATLDIGGNSTFRGIMGVSRSGDATTSQGAPSFPIMMQSSVWNSSVGKEVLPYFDIETEPVGNNTASAGATLNFLYFSGVGSAPSESGLYINGNGTIHFAPGQTFPSTSSSGTALAGTSGSGTGVQGTSTSATGVAGSSTTGNGMLGYTSGSTLNTAGVLGGAGGPSGFGGIAGVWGDAYSHVGVLGTSQLYAGVQGISNYGQGVQGQSALGFGVQGTSTSSYGVSGTSTTSNGVYGSTGGTSLYTAGVLGTAGTRTSAQAIAGVWGDSGNHVGVFGSSTQYPGVAGQSTQGQGVQGTSTSGTGVQGISTSSYGVEGSSTSAPGVLGYTAGSTSNTGGVVGQAGGTSGFGGIAGVWGDASAYVGVYGSSNTYAGVDGISNHSPGVVGTSTSASGVYGVSNDTNGSDDVAGVYGYATGALPAVKGRNAGTNGPAAMFINDSISAPAVIGINAAGGANVSSVAVYGDSAQSSGIGVEGNTLSGIGVYATTNAQSTGFQLSNFVGPVALWADSTPPNGDGEGIAIRATANGNNAGSFTNNSQYSTIYSYNYGSGGSGADAFNAIEAASPNGVCGFGGNGDMTCTGQVKTLATTGNGARTVETYSMQSPENWMEDFGSGTLQNGLATVSIDAAFAETVSGNGDYHVFLTPRGDSKGLYVTNTTATSFEVHESGGGTATLGFDYRIVAKRRGFETQRMLDVTEAMRAVKAKNDLQAARFKKVVKE